MPVLGRIAAIGGAAGDVDDAAAAFLAEMEHGEAAELGGGGGVDPPRPLPLAYPGRGGGGAPAPPAPPPFPGPGGRRRRVSLRRCRHCGRARRSPRRAAPAPRATR